MTTISVTTHDTFGIQANVTPTPSTTDVSKMEIVLKAIPGVSAVFCHAGPGNFTVYVANDLFDRDEIAKKVHDILCSLTADSAPSASAGSIRIQVKKSFSWDPTHWTIETDHRHTDGELLNKITSTDGPFASAFYNGSYNINVRTRSSDETASSVRTKAKQIIDEFYGPKPAPFCIQQDSSRASTQDMVAFKTNHRFRQSEKDKLQGLLSTVDGAYGMYFDNDYSFHCYRANDLFDLATIAARVITVTQEQFASK